MKRSTQVVHVNQHVIRANKKNKTTDPPLIVRNKQRGKSKAHYGQMVDILYKGEIVGNFVYSPQHPLSCGAHVWCQSDKLQFRPRAWTKEEAERQHVQPACCTG